MIFDKNEVSLIKFGEISELSFFENCMLHH